MATAGAYTSPEWRSSKEYAGLTGFAKAVYELCAAIPAGKVATYGVLAEALSGSTKSARAVGTALHHNPFAPAVPCHRVIRQGGSIGGFAGSVEESNSSNIVRKRDLLGSEGVRFSDGGSASPTVMMTVADFDSTAVARARELWQAAPAAAVKRRREEGLVIPSHASTLATLAYTGAQSGKQLKSTTGDALRDSLSAAGARGADVRAAARCGELRGHTSGLAPGYAQANLVIIPREYAFEFLLFASRNPKPCPLLEVCEAGVCSPTRTATGADVRTDVPAYTVWRHGEKAETVADIRHLWPDAPFAPGSSPDARLDWVTFIIGCSFSFEQALLAAGLPVRHLQQEQGADTPVPHGGMAIKPRNVPMYRTTVATESAGVFRGPLVVSMRPMTPEQACAADDITAAFPRVHGRPVFAGDAAALGIADINKPDYGDPVCILPGEVPVFWACGVTPQAALAQARIPLAITHAPGHMLVLDVSNDSLAGVPEATLPPEAAAVTLLGAGSEVAPVASRRKSRR